MKKLSEGILFKIMDSKFKIIENVITIQNLNEYVVPIDNVMNILNATSFRLPLYRHTKALVAAGKVKPIMLHDPVNPKSKVLNVPPSLFMFSRKEQGKAITYVNLSSCKYIRDTAGEISGLDTSHLYLYAMLQGGFISYVINDSANKDNAIANSKIVDITCNSYVNLFAKAIDRKKSFASKTELMDAVKLIIAVYFLNGIVGIPLLSAVPRAIRLLRLPETVKNSRYYINDPTEIPDLNVMIDVINSELEGTTKINLSISSYFIELYGPKTLLIMEYLPYFTSMISLVSLKANIFKDRVIYSKMPKSGTTIDKVLASKG